MMMDLTGQLSNLSTAVETVLLLNRTTHRESVVSDHRTPRPSFRQRPYELVRDALVQELTADGSGLRLMEIRLRVEDHLGGPVDQKRFKDYVNDQSRGADALLERLAWGTYRLRS
jgi:hypothetical protein